jgi:transcriptional regulator with XRE-family HTH domain
MRAIQTGLNELLWERVSEVLSEQHRQYPDLWQQLGRDKNTYTSWRNGRTIPRLSDLEEIAQALRVSPADLLRRLPGQETPKVAEQLELPFEPGGKGAKLELEYTSIGFVLRLPRKSA